MLIRIRVGWNAALTYLPSLLTDNIRYTERLSTAITIRQALLTSPGVRISVTVARKLARSNAPRIGAV